MLSSELDQLGAEAVADIDAPMAHHPQRLPFAFARRHGLFVERGEDQQLILYHRPTVALSSLLEAQRVLDGPFTLQSVAADRFDGLLQRAYEHSRNDTMQAIIDLGDEIDLAYIVEQLSEPEDLLESEDDAPIIRYINAMLTDAIKDGASDIHIEPFEHDLVVRFRVDGVLREKLQPRRILAPLLVSRIKVMAKLDIAEKRLPQDGRISVRVAGRAVDIRVSTLPSGHGERVVLRLLDKQAGRLDLAHLGMASATRDAIDRLIHQPHGILLVTGPTGSGKTTTLYAALTRLNDRSRNIMTVEDPIEYYLDGVGQTQVNTKVDMSFARGLRAILRQDPDVVMVGEIRDLETVQIAIQSSLTGHLVLSTLHTNTAVGAITRLRDMGVEPFLLSSSLIGIVSQRLVRLLCHHCRQPYQADAAICRQLNLDPAAPPTLYHASGCNHCNALGYRGRTGIYELVLVDEKLRGLIHSGSSEQVLEQQARSRTASLRDDGIRRVLAGETTLEEVLRVTHDND